MDSVKYGNLLQLFIRDIYSRMVEKYLSSDLVSALPGLDVDDFPHCRCFTKI